MDAISTASKPGGAARSAAKKRRLSALDKAYGKQAAPIESRSTTESVKVKEDNLKLPELTASAHGPSSSWRPSSVEQSADASGTNSVELTTTRSPRMSMRACDAKRYYSFVSFPLLAWCDVSLTRII